MSDPHLVTGGGQVRLPLMEPRFWSRQTEASTTAGPRPQQQSGGGRKWCEMNSEK